MPFIGATVLGMVCIAHTELSRLAAEVLVHAGVDPGDADLVSDVLVWADRRGRFAQGTIWLETLCDRVISGDVVSPGHMSMTEPYATTLRIDASNGFGHVGGQHAVAFVSDRAPVHGLALATVRNSSHFGPCGYYADQLASRGLIGLVATNAFPKVAPHGGRAAALGTNPLAFAAPAETDPSIIGDLSTGALAGSRVREAKAKQRPLERGSALDRFGKPTVDADELENDGVMLPFGGPKGFALGILVEILTSGLAGGLPPDELGSMFTPGRVGTSHFILAIAAPPDFANRISHLRKMILTTSAQEDMEIRIPGDVGHDLQRSDEVDLPTESTAAIRRAAIRVGMQIGPVLN